jgi:hypothetical protein
MVDYVQPAPAEKDCVDRPGAWTEHPESRANRKKENSWLERDSAGE